MQTRPNFIGILALVAVLAVLGGAWYFVSHRQAKVCPFSGREIHPETRAVVTVGGKKYEVCCVRCAMIEAQQTGKPLKVLKVADFETSRLMDPGNAWFVEGSAVNECMRMSPAAESPSREGVYLRSFDRCSPSVLAFSTEQHARDFIAQHGGALKRLSDLESDATSKTGKVQTP